MEAGGNFGLIWEKLWLHGGFSFALLRVKSVNGTWSTSCMGEWLQGRVLLSGGVCVSLSMAFSWEVCVALCMFLHQSSEGMTSWYAHFKCEYFFSQFSWSTVHVEGYSRSAAWARSPLGCWTWWGWPKVRLLPRQSRNQLNTKSLLIHFKMAFTFS